jgi:hypothetical protein
MMQLNEFLHVCQECVAEKRDRCHAAIISQAGLKTIQIKALPKTDKTGCGSGKPDTLPKCHNTLGYGIGSQARILARAKCFTLRASHAGVRQSGESFLALFTSDLTR